MNGFGWLVNGLLNDWMINFLPFPVKWQSYCRTWSDHTIIHKDVLWQKVVEQRVARRSDMTAGSPFQVFIHFSRFHEGLCVSETFRNVPKGSQCFGIIRLTYIILHRILDQKYHITEIIARNDITGPKSYVKIM